MELIEGSPEVVCDAGPLIHLHEVGCLDLLSGFAAIWVPDAVLAEVEQHRPAVLTIDSPKIRRLRTDTIRDPHFLAVALPSFACKIARKPSSSPMTLLRGWRPRLFVGEDHRASREARGMTRSPRRITPENSRQRV